MRTIFDIMGELLNKKGKELESELKKEFIIEEIGIEVEGKYEFNRIRIAGRTDGEFVIASGETYEITLDKFKSQLPRIGALLETKQKKLAALRSEIEALEGATK